MMPSRVAGFRSAKRERNRARSRCHGDAWITAWHSWHKRRLAHLARRAPSLFGIKRRALGHDAMWKAAIVRASTDGVPLAQGSDPP